MQQNAIFEIYRNTENQIRHKRDSLNKGKKGSVYSRGGTLWVDFHYFGERVRESSGLNDTRENKQALRKKLDLILAEIENGVFVFSDRFPLSKKKAHFAKLEGRHKQKGPDEIMFGKYHEKWWKALKPGMSESQKRDYESIIRFHLLPIFRDMFFSEISPVVIKKFIAELKNKKNDHGEPLSAKRIHNILIPMRTILKDATEEYGWADFKSPFLGLKLPITRKFRIQPFDFNEWETVMRFMKPWYRLYFWFAVLTGLRPSEQVALKWSAVDDRFIHVELSRVRNHEKMDMKTEESRRSIDIRSSIRAILDLQRKQTAGFNSPYVFINTRGRPILQDKLRELWMRVMKESKVPYRRMYETRHTFASWALTSGESPEWVARTLGHVDTSMVFRTYFRYIPNLTRKDGSAIENQFAKIFHDRDKL